MASLNTVLSRTEYTVDRQITLIPIPWLSNNSRDAIPSIFLSQS
ncbi:hypothetical protein CGMCC3_g6656 [Colletotrichum fructicola]|nr:uncharacterized protein CGMCC3_g6656 [Colletotrichum fructicola]KAE9577406.1 hypothetical protein CGMCC3_g6656 [Colletotrichum fructicola]